MEITITNTYPIDKLSLLTFKGFYNFYEKLWFEGNIQRKAYLLTEKEYYKYYQTNKYSTFESFMRVANSKYNRK